MLETTERSLSDQEFVRQVGIAPALEPHLPFWKKLLLSVVALFAALSIILGASFASSSTSADSGMQTATTQCPMTGNSPKPSR